MNPQDDCNTMPEIRADFHAILSEEALEKFISDMDNVACDLKTPYLASATMWQAEYTNWPFRKLNHFKAGKQILEDYIAKNPNNIEARYVRLLCQLNAPGFLNYDNIEEDRTFINTHIGTANLSEDYKQIMLFNIKKHTDN
ncbi:hypothetical protein FNB79_01995 [Formosa sediminum]|uniref:Uncharacterized protein n=1 Tax=Formosa sediminum TaxID=2594004 RepID=A0A516GMN9_9FLAO|nr:hypothetical protein [Formosa sediminum]QDO92796.1 hypothetical protein FNB79_01995 [Formosa sediminum]